MSIAKLLTTWTNNDETSVQSYSHPNHFNSLDGVYLTGPQADFIKSFLSKGACQLQEDRKHFKECAKQFYDLAEEGTETGEMYFTALNSCRDRIRETRRIEKRINDVIRALKNR
jgi:hypothetical protein